jgi:hypothetical protein
MIKAFRQILNFEFKRLLCRRNIIGFFLLLIVIFVVVQIAIIDYKSFLKDKEIINELEKEKVKHYHLYSQYGGFGVELPFITSPLSVFFADSINGVLLSNINAAERLKIYKHKKGKYYNESVGLMDFSGILYIFGCFFSLVAGFTVIRKRDFLKFHSDSYGYKRFFPGLIIARIIFLNMILGLLVLLAFIMSLISGISINFIFLWFVLVASLVFFVYFLIGVIAGAIKEKIIAFVVLVAVFFGAVFFIPWTIEKITQLAGGGNIESLFNFKLTNIKIYTKLERRLFEKYGIFKTGDVPRKGLITDVEKTLNNEFEEIFRREGEMKLSQLRNIKFNQILSSLFPTTLYLSLRKELSSAGDLNSIEFYSFCMEMKKKFIKYYIIKRLNTQQRGKGTVQNFIKGNENEFIAKSRLPYGFGLGIGVTILYIIGLLFWSYRLHIRRLKVEESREIDFNVNFEEGKNTLFVLCKDEAIKREIFNHYEQKDAACIEKINPADFKMNGIKPADLLKHLSRVAGVDEKRARENLGIMGVDIDTVKNSHETILKIYAAVMTAGDHRLIILNDFLKRESRQFESDLVELFSTLLSAGKKIIYLSTEMYQTAIRFEDKIKIDKFGNFPILDRDIKEISLR